MVGGVLAAVLSLIVGVSGGLAVWVGVGGGVLVFAILYLLTAGSVTRQQATLPALFPAGDAEAEVEDALAADRRLAARSAR